MRAGKKYYCVWAEYPDQGPAWTALYESVRAVKPKNICRSTPGRDVYNDWFEEEAEARRFLAAIQAEAERSMVETIKGKGEVTP